VKDNPIFFKPEENEKKKRASRDGGREIYRVSAIKKEVKLKWKERRSCLSSTPIFRFFTLFKRLVYL